ncbi:MAG: hypothetical protein ACPLYF_04765 [Fervidobacterium sp.]
MSIKSLPSIPSPHSVVKFWARKPLSLIMNEIPHHAKILDPFCGSGTVGLGSVLRGSSALLSDLNPVSVFITWTLLNRYHFSEHVLAETEYVLKEIENEAYKVQDEVLDYAVWTNKYICKRCGGNVPYETIRIEKPTCKTCRSRLCFDEIEIKEKVIELRTVSGQGSKRYKSRRLLRDYREGEENFKIRSWHPSGPLIYPGTNRIFREVRRWRSLRIEELFTKRGLCAASKVYEYVEDVCNEHPEEGDLLKLVFIASLVSATKMVPHCLSSGPSWKIPRYWIPHLREERNFIRSFLRRLHRLKDYKDVWLKKAKDYDFYFLNDLTDFQWSQKSVGVARSDARKVEVSSSVDLVILDPPHFNEIHYFELFYVWQRWLQGKHNDVRFADYNYWSQEIDVNPNAGRNEEYYIKEISYLVSKYLGFLRRHGELLLILHHNDKNVLGRSLKQIKDTAFCDFSVRSSIPLVPSSAQGLHKKPKRLYLAKIVPK